jgi:hypothetical protein
MLHFLLVPAMLTATPAAEYHHLGGISIIQICNPQAAENSFCFGYIVGTVDSFEATRAFAHQSPCVPLGVPVSQLLDITLAYLKRSPERHQYAAPGVIIAAMKDAFKCQ